MNQPRENPPARGISLGWRLAILTALILTAVMGTVTVLQQRREIALERSDREGLLKESLAPLVYRIARAQSQERLSEEFSEFCEAFVRTGYPAHRVELKDSEGRIVISTMPEPPARPKGYFQVSVPVASPILNGRRGTITLWEDSSEYNQMVSWEWRSWLLHMAVTIVPIFIFVMLGIRYVVTGPLERLLDRVRKMEMGYWDQPAFEEGPWEIRWLGWRFRNLGLELKNTVEELVRAEKRALIAPYARSPESMAAPSGAGPNATDLSLEREYEKRCAQLQREYQELVSRDAADPRTVALARKVWERDSGEAGELGDIELRSALEDASMRILEPAAFADLKRQLESKKDTMAAWIAQREADLRRSLSERGIPQVDVTHRVKHLAGIWKKMQLKRLAADEIDDLYAFRVVVPTESDCYLALGAIHEIFEPVVGRFNDYIASPKPNGYQSIHTCVRAADGPIFEIQIRSTAMHYEAEQGCAAHWMYKGQQVVPVSNKLGLSSVARRFLGMWKRRGAA